MDSPSKVFSTTNHYVSFWTELDLTLMRSLPIFERQSCLPRIAKTVIAMDTSKAGKARLFACFASSEK
jgi:hypothetical protein